MASSAGGPIAVAMAGGLDGIRHGAVRCAMPSIGCATRWLPGSRRRAREFLKDPWAARDEYIDVVLDRGPESLAAFFARHAARELAESDRVTVLKLLELQRHLMLMYTSCGWFFDELSGIETVQVIQYACRAVQLSQEVLGNHVEAEFLEALATSQEQHSRTQGRRLHLSQVRRAGGGRPGEAGRPLRHQLALQAVRRSCPHLLLLGRSAGSPQPGSRPHEAGTGPRAIHF